MSTYPKMYEFLKNLNAEIKKWILPETEMKLVEVRVMTAKSSGMPCISVLWGFRDLEFLIAHDARIFVTSPLQIC